MSDNTEESIQEDVSFVRAYAEPSLVEQRNRLIFEAVKHENTAGFQRLAQIRRDVWGAIMTTAVSRAIDPSVVLAEIVNGWGASKLAEWENVREATNEAAKDPRCSTRTTEKTIEREILRVLHAAGIDAKSQVRTSAGDADLVVFRDASPICVIEVKLAFRGKREIRRACGQARGYADALGAKLAIVSAPDVDATERFGVPVVAPTAVLHTLQAMEGCRS